MTSYWENPLQHIIQLHKSLIYLGLKKERHKCDFLFHSGSHMTPNCVTCAWTLLWKLRFRGHLFDGVPEAEPCAVTFSRSADDVDLVAHRSAEGQELLAEDHGLDPNLEPVRRIREGLNIAWLKRDSSDLLNTFCGHFMNNYYLTCYRLPVYIESYGYLQVLIVTAAVSWSILVLPKDLQ